MNMNKCENSKAIAQKQSILEGEIEQLKRESLRVNSLSGTILDILRPSPPCSPSCDPVNPGTVADLLRNIRAIDEGSRDNLESVSRILEEQLGGLKLEY